MCLLRGGACAWCSAVYVHPRAYRVRVMRFLKVGGTFGTCIKFVHNRWSPTAENLFARENIHKNSLLYLNEGYSEVRGIGTTQ